MLMIHRIEIENFGSIRERQIIDLGVPATAPALERFPNSRASERVRLPTVVAFFGPNASGKSTVLRAVVRIMDFVAHSFGLAPDAPLAGFQPFRDDEWWRRATSIAIEFDADWIGDQPRAYRYQLALENGEVPGARVSHESLRIRDGRRFRLVFQRNGQGIRCASELQLPPADARLKAVRPNASVISTMAQLNHDFFRKAHADIDVTQRYVADYGSVLPDAQNALRFLHTYGALEELRAQISRFDVGIKDISIEETPAGLMVLFQHEGLNRPVRVAEESNGTRSFISIFPALWFSLKTGRPALIDEFDVDLHPLLIPEILNWFQDPESNPQQAQLFFAAHNVSIMDHLEKEEIYLVEKSRDGASAITALKDIRGVRREPSLQRKYLGGVFGAVPNIG